MLDGARADAGEGFPEADGMVVTCCTENDRHTRTQLASDWAIDTMLTTPFVAPHIGMLRLGLVVRFPSNEVLEAKDTIMQAPALIDISVFLNAYSL